MLHVADEDYYKFIENSMSQYDFVLYELITSSANTESVLDCSNVQSHKMLKKRLAKDIISPQAELLASHLGFRSQLKSLYIPNRSKAGWYVADLDSETITAMESANKDSTSSRYILSRLFGRTFSEQLLRGFFISDRVSHSNKW